MYRIGVKVREAACGGVPTADRATAGSGVGVECHPKADTSESPCVMSPAATRI